MSSPLITLDADATLAEARDRMAHHGVHHLLVRNRRRIVAVLSDRDLLRQTSPYIDTASENERDAATLRRHVFRAASYDLVTVDFDQPIEDAAALLLDRGVSCLPVRDGAGEVIGIVTSRDLLRGVLSCALPLRGQRAEDERGAA
jgi:acetoin utilization protein AcuB